MGKKKTVSIIPAPIMICKKLMREDAYDFCVEMEIPKRELLEKTIGKEKKIAMGNKKSVLGVIRPSSKLSSMRNEARE